MEAFVVKDAAAARQCLTHLKAFWAGYKPKEEIQTNTYVDTNTIQYIPKLVYIFLSFFLKVFWIWW